jgi:receptor expression-enhancing protein 5/6
MTIHLPPQVQQALNKVDVFMSKYPTVCQYEKMKQLETKTGYPKAGFFLVAVMLVFSLVFSMGGAKLLTDLVSFIYPAYMSFKAIDSANELEHTQWLTYWVVFSFVSIIESIFAFLTDFIPFYFFLKVGFFIWLYHPKFLGAGLVYAQGIKPFVIPYIHAVTSSTDGSGKKTL